MKREGFDLACCTVQRSMRDLGLRGVIQDKPVQATIADKVAPCPLDQVNRQFHTPARNMPWVSDFTYVAAWARFVHVAFVIDAYARYIVGWHVTGQRTPASCWMHWSRQSTIDDPFIALA